MTRIARRLAVRMFILVFGSAAPMPGAIARDPSSPARRRFLEQTAGAVSATPFVPAAYGFLYGRLDV